MFKVLFLTSGRINSKHIELVRPSLLDFIPQKGMNIGFMEDVSGKVFEVFCDFTKGCFFVWVNLETVTELNGRDIEEEAQILCSNDPVWTMANPTQFVSSDWKPLRKSPRHCRWWFW